MRRVRVNMPLVVGVATSMLVHAAVLLPLLVMVMTARSELSTFAVKLDKDDFRVPEEPEEEPDVPLGIDESTASTMTWIGYDTYQEHMAALANVEQAAFTTTPGDVPQEPVPAAAASPEATEQPTPSAPLPPSLVELMLTRLAEAVEQAPVIARETPDIEPVEVPREKPPEQVAEKPAEEPTEQPSEEQPPQPAVAAGDPGDPADRESDATSLEVTVDELKIGKPLAAEGLEVKTVRPRFTTLQRLTQSPRNPLAEMEFRGDGRVMRVRFIETTGTSVDEALKSSLFRWRASGKRIEELKGKQTITIRIRIFL